jgi:protein phosphatase 1L
MEQGKGGNTGDSSLFACYDGHGGERASQYCLEKLLKSIRDERYFSEDPQIAIREGIRKINDEFSTIARRNSYMDGTTVIMAVIHDKRIVVANVGDSRAIVVGNYKNQLKYRDMSQDHKPERPDEKRRIEKLGGQVIFHGRPRVQGILAVSRAVGDVQLQPYVTAEPEIMDKTIEADDEFLVLASDGLWDVMNNKAVAEFLLERRKKVSLANIAKELCMEALLRGTQDNVTVLVVDLTEAGRSECLNGKTNGNSSSKSK